MTTIIDQDFPTSFSSYNSHIVKVPEEASGIVEDFWLRGILLDNSRIPWGGERGQDQVCELLQSVPGKTVLEVITWRQIPENACKAINQETAEWDNIFAEGTIQQD